MRAAGKVMSNTLLFALQHLFLAEKCRISGCFALRHDATQLAYFAAHI
jgi:hypothetical protein